MTLDNVQPGQLVEIISLRGGWGMRQRLNQLGISVGRKVIVKRSSPFGGPILVVANGSEIAIGRGMAHHILVRLHEEN